MIKIYTKSKTRKAGNWQGLFSTHISWWKMVYKVGNWGSDFLLIVYWSCVTVFNFSDKSFRDDVTVKPKCVRFQVVFQAMMKSWIHKRSLLLVQCLHRIKTSGNEVNDIQISSGIVPKPLMLTFRKLWSLNSHLTL